MGKSVSANVLPFGDRSRPFERRRHERMSVPNIRAHPQGERIEILDMSHRGMAIRTLHPFSVGGSYLFELFDEGRSLVIEGQVCWCKRVAPAEPPAEMGVAPSFRTGVSFVGIQNRHLESAAQGLGQLPAPSPQPAEDEEKLTADRIERLKVATSPDESAELLLDLLSVDFEHLVLFRVRGEEIRAWLGRGPTLVPERLMKLRLNLDQASIFQHLEQGGSFFYGMLPAMFAHLQLLRCWHGSLHRECVLFPVRIKDRLVAVLYADTGDRSLAPEHLGNLKAATELLTRSLIDQILRRKAAATSNSS